jgi:hypothetical protein
MVRIAYVRLPLMGNIQVAIGGALGKRLIARHEELSYQAFLARRASKR